MDWIIYTIMVIFATPFGDDSRLLGCFSSLEAAKTAADKFIAMHAELLDNSWYYNRIIRIEMDSREMNMSKLDSLSILTYDGVTKKWLKSPMADRLVKSTLELSTEDDTDESSNS